MKPSPDTDWIWSYGRAFLLTLGVAIIGLMGVVWIVQGDRSGKWPAFAWALFSGMILAGGFFCAFAFLASNKAIKRWADSSGTHPGEIIIAILAAPVYWIGKQLQKPGRRG